MIQETITHQNGTTNNTQSLQSSQKKRKFFGTILKIKIRKKNNNLKYQLECNNNNKSSNSSTKTLSDSSTSPSNSVTSFSDKGSIKQESTKSLSKSTSLFHFFWNNNSTLKHKSSTTETLTSSDGQENLEGLTKKKRTLFNFFNRDSFKKYHNNVSNSTVNSSDSSIESSSIFDQNDSAYETETENYALKKKDKKKGKEKKSEESKSIRKTKLLTLSSKDKEYIEIQEFFRIGLPNKKILGIIRLQMPTKLVEAHEKYKKDVALSNNLSESQICHRMFHGTKTSFICKPQHFINNKCALFCKIGCGVCGIAQEGNRTKYSHYTQRMWFANNSATSLSYCSNNNVKAMFVVDVVSPLPNSILIIEKDEATIPKYLIVFQE
ncbi:hypothetical protein C1645_824177 [Glomus cerebriforme]|uniref:Uncharacterized protein n=1 Tax=Glomus cerebriforme TaxID=658196 RepID=A0A397T3Y6_9GLOM|nr:hypothetical protein C1645_824177 [Glomus cerebriforme]